MKKSLTRKLTIAVIALVFAVVSLSTSTYAWFTMSNTANINAFEAQVKAAEGIEIAVTTGKEVGNAQWYVGEIPSEIIQGVANPANANFKFDAVTPNQILFENETFMDRDNVEKTGGWISFYVHIKAANAGTIFVDDVTLTTTGANPWTVTVPFNAAAENNTEYTVNDKVTYEVANAARVAFVTEENNAYQVYENDAAPSTDSVAGNSLGCPTSNGAFAYYNAINPSDELDADKVADYESKAVTATLGNAEDGSAVKLGDVTAGGTITAQVLVWIEGWDGECLNAIFEQTLSVVLDFKYEA